MNPVHQSGTSHHNLPLYLPPSPEKSQGDWGTDISVEGKCGPPPALETITFLCLPPSWGRVLSVCIIMACDTF